VVGDSKEIDMMIGSDAATRSRTRRWCLAAAIVAFGVLPGCRRPAPNRLQGYVEGEFVYVASPFAGRLDALYVERGAQVKAGDPLFALESEPEKAARDEARQRVDQARATLNDLQKGKRPPEIESIEAQLRQAQKAAAFSQEEFARQEKLFSSGATTAQNLDRARATRDQDRQRVAQLEADLKTAQLGSRSDQIAAAEANVRALEAALDQAEWALSQKRPAASQAGLVFDTLYRPGEWVAEGRPVVALLPPQNIKVRTFVPEPRIGGIHPGDRVRIVVDGLPEPLSGTVSFISPQAEYTPPVIYSRENRSKLVFMVEIVFAPETAARLHPGQPVDVLLGP
jgi:HlyD family secretion protein